MKAIGCDPNERLPLRVKGNASAEEKERSELGMCPHLSARVNPCISASHKEWNGDGR